jgi:hypothetical protein
VFALATAVGAWQVARIYRSVAPTAARLSLGVPSSIPA